MTATTLYGVYHPDNPQECLYVGITSGELHVRQNSHWAAAMRGRTKGAFPDWMRKHAHDRARVEFVSLHVFETREEALTAEVETIRGLRAVGQARLNTSDGGDGQTPGFRHSEESKKRMSYPAEQSPKAKLTWQEVRELRLRASEKYVPVVELAETFNMSQNQVRNILSGKAWKDDKYDPARWITRFKVTSMEDAAEIRRLRSEGHRTRALSRRFSVSESTIRTILQNTTRTDPGYDPASVRPLTAPGAKLTPESVQDIRTMHLQGEAPESIARKYSVTPTNVYYILNRTTWSAVE